MCSLFFLLFYFYYVYHAFSKKIQIFTKLVFKKFFRKRYNEIMKVIVGKDTTDLVIHNIYPDGMPVNPKMMNPHIGGLRKQCKHVYEYVYAEVCPLCGGDTHEPNYDLQNKLHRQHILDGKDKEHKCTKCGGTIIGAWDI